MQPRNRDAGGLRGLRRIETTQEQPVFVRCGGGKRRTAVRGIRFVYLAPGRRLVQDRRPSRPILQDIPLPAIVCNLTTGKKGVYTPADQSRTGTVVCSTIAPTYACLTIRVTSRAVTRFHAATRVPSGLRATQFAVLVGVFRGFGTTLASFGQALAMDRTSYPETSSRSPTVVS